MKSVSVEMLQKYASDEDPAGVDTAICKSCFIGRIRLQSEIKKHSIASDPCRIDAIIFYFCTEGASTLICNLEEYHLQPNSFVVLPPKSIVEMEFDQDTHYGGYIMAVDPSYMGDADLNLRKIIGVLMNEHVRHGVLQLSDAERERVEQLFALAFATISQQQQTPFRDDIVRAILNLFVYQSCDLLSIYNDQIGDTPSSSSRAEEYFRRFVKTLSEHYLERRSVTFYADQLCISSRYLTTIVRRVSGHSVTDWMNRYVMMEARYLLRYSEMSIQEIAYKLNFPNQSFFGKYFKQHAGISPSAYRQKN